MGRGLKWARAKSPSLKWATIFLAQPLLF
ncbi:uncharacterized protein G2W53_015528 [Senna tora]|uniref:Uncharacterized protein n=1 Tax=Senna tora TaxID=362788 RepID=A0A834WUZ5_9FABA|nr:uncharacterized protein G2W53_015528 [Senna tora]